MPAASCSLRRQRCRTAVGEACGPLRAAAVGCRERPWIRRWPQESGRCIDRAGRRAGQGRSSLRELSRPTTPIYPLSTHIRPKHRLHRAPADALSQRLARRHSLWEPHARFCPPPFGSRHRRPRYLLRSGTPNSVRSGAVIVAEGTHPGPRRRGTAGVVLLSHVLPKDKTGKQDLLHSMPNPLSKMAHPAGLEPATPRLEGGCSIRLSYGCPPRL